MNDRAHAIFRSAQMYERAARSLNAASSSDPSLLMPSVVNAALCLELYLKSVYVLDKQTEFKVRNRHSHDFFALFEQLPDSTRHQLSERFDGALAVRDMSDVNRLENSFQVVVARDLRANLANWATVFTELRYVYHFLERQTGQQKTMMFFPEIAASVAGVILDREPTWRP